ncbi:AAA domain-containing protein [Microbacterium lacticum]|uniref:AAA domain-containing protein n=1 Tax=Microbacterium lacticum TaxID=33885 RepID=UPI00242B6591|nr:AAA domain-containing protein [Microbacterium lacticum]
MGGIGTDPVVLDNRFVLPRDELSSGGHARLFKAYDNETGAHVAVKLFAPATHVDPRTLELSWSNELDVYSRLEAHPNLLQVVGFGTPAQGAPWIAFEWCGEDLGAVTKRESLSWEQLRPLALEILAGLSVLHAKGWVHRDLKPGNVLVDGAQVKVADFGTMRYREVTSFGKTMSQLGTRPYCPPESGTENPLPAYDVYSFAVLVICCLLGDFELNGTTPTAALGRVVVPEPIRLLLARCLSDEQEQRPGSAGVVLAELEQIAKGEAGAQNVPEIGIHLPVNVTQIFRDVTLAETAGFEEFRREFGPRVRLVRDPKFADRQGLLLVGQSLLAAVAPHESRNGYFFVKHVWRPPIAHLERLRKRGIGATIRWVATPMRPLEADAAISELLRSLAEREAANPEQHSRVEVHDRWERVLDAKFAIARERGKDVNYSALRVEGARVYLTTTDRSADPQLGELRVIRSTTGRFVRGEVEAIEGSAVVFYVNEGNPDDLPRKGVLSVDAERTVSKLRREQDAVRRVFEGRAVRADLKDILSNPAVNPLPAEHHVEQFVQDHLDDAKRTAVASVLGSQGISLVKGPPGTGKTTLIAELVAQQLRIKPDAQILLASQTHIALDHALSKVAKVTPAASVLRIGSPDQLSASSEAWTVPSQLEAWRVETEGTVAAFVQDHLQSAGVLDVQTRSAATRLRAQVERRTRTEAELVDAGAALGAAREEQESTRAAIEKLFAAVSKLETTPADSADVVARDLSRLTDAVEQLGVDLEQRSPAIRQIEGLRERVAQLRERLTELREDTQRAVTELRKVGDFADAVDEEDMLRRIDESMSADDERVQALQLLAEDWLERFRPTGEFRVALLFRASVVASTCVALTGSKGAERVEFDLCIIDEASKATPTELMVPMANARQWVLVGDDKQLPPFLDSALVDADFLTERELTRADVDERLFTELGAGLPAQSVAVLSHQHRMHPVIGKVVSDVFYGGELRSSAREVSPLVQRALGGAVTWRDTGRKESERRSGLSYENRTEARAVAELVGNIDNYAVLLGLDEVEIAVLAGYAAQVRTLQEVLSSTKSKLKVVRVKAATIDSYQGQEADICIVSLTRSNRRGEVGFLGSPERLNVAISRARDGLVIVGNRAMADGSGDRRRSRKLTEVSRAIAAAGGRNGR